MPWLGFGRILPALAWALVALSSTVEGVTAVSTTTLTAGTPIAFDSQLNRCPESCSRKSSEQWTVYSSFERLSICDQPMLFDLAIHTPVHDDSKAILIRACTSKPNSLHRIRYANDKTKRDDGVCINSAKESRVSLQLDQEASTLPSGANGALLRGLNEMKNYFGKYAAISSCSKDYDIILSYYNGTVVGVYAGKALGKTTVPAIIDKLTSHTKRSEALATNSIAQICDGKRDMDHIAGLAIATATDFDYVQSALVSWSEGKCVGKGNKTSEISGWSQDMTIQETYIKSPSDGIISNKTVQSLPSSLMSQQAAGKYCTTQPVAAGDTCDSLAKSCKLSVKDFFKYNNAGDGKDWCSKLQIGRNVCCSPGSLRPLPEDDGTCYTYTVKAGDDCSKIGMPWDLTPKDIASFNDKVTWGWRGCSNLGVGMKMCLSKGYPPMPAPVTNAICGPQKPGTPSKGQIKDSAGLAALNPCPLNSCCNIWGQCGIDTSFCKDEKGPTGNPGTSPPGVNGCISNCGTEIVNNNAPINGGYKRVGYYEVFNWDRPCLHQRAEWANTMNYTHIHWAFGDIRKDQSIYVNDTHDQWNSFMDLQGVKKIVSFGGWGVSTDPSTYNILRDAMDPKNRDRFVSNVVAFAKKTGIDGIDFDWEYPGAPDIPGIPKGLDSDAPNYLDTLRALRKALPDEYSISIAAPASYWYLKQFPIADMSKVLNYIVYMTYDLHGQWDHGNQWAMGGCPAGNCLRSHVNETEVMFSLAMVTKAGVNADKIVVGESSYGRSFHMAQLGCTGPECTFTGTSTISDAAKGRCTNTGGYLANAEIQEIIEKSGGSNMIWYDEDTGSDYLVYNNTEWVAYMTDKTKESRRKKWQDLNFLGTIDWALDLQEFNVADSVGPSGAANKSSCVQVFDNMIWDWANPAVEAAPGCTNILQPSPLPSKVTLTAYTTILLQSGHSVSSTVVTAPFTISEVSFQPFTFDKSDVTPGQPITYNPVPRVTPDPVTIRIPPGWTVTTPGGRPTVAPPKTSIIGLPDPSGDDPGGNDPTGNNPTGNNPTGNNPTGNDPSNDPTGKPTGKPTGNDPTGNNPPGSDPTGNNPTGNDPTGNNPTGTLAPTATSTSSDIVGGIIFPITWDPTLSYRLPSIITPKPPAPSKIPEDDHDPAPGPPPASVPDCNDNSCTRGQDCHGDDCTRGGDCIGPNCGGGGGCIGPRCIRGGNCIGFNCFHGGICEGDLCDLGGGCSGPNCKSGGDCVGPHCRKGGGCDRQTTDCNPGGCKGEGCFGETKCRGAQCERITIKIPTITPIIPKPTCLINCPRLPECPLGELSCNKPCHLEGCPPDREPTNKACTTLQTGRDCTEFVSSTRVKVTPTTSWSTTTRTRCETVLDCDPMDVTTTTTISTKISQALLISPTVNWDYPATAPDDEDFYSSIASDYDDWKSSLEAPPPKPTPKPKPTPEAKCIFTDQFFAYRFYIWNIKNWSDDGGEELQNQESGCGALTDWVWHEPKGKKAAGCSFLLPFFIKDGCVERAIASAGGPEIECDGDGVEFPGDDDEDPWYGSEEAMSIKNATAAANSTMTGRHGNHTYVPMHWH